MLYPANMAGISPRYIAVFPTHSGLFVLLNNNSYWLSKYFFMSAPSDVNANPSLTKFYSNSPKKDFFGAISE
jgi:hypothetical protein